MRSDRHRACSLVKRRRGGQSHGTARRLREKSPRYIAEIAPRYIAEIRPRCAGRGRGASDPGGISAVHLGDISRRYISACISAMYLTEAEGKYAERVAFGGTERLKRRARVDPLREIRRDQAEIAASGAHRSAV